MNLQKGNPDQIVVLKGNHEEMFVDFLFSKEDDLYWLGFDQDLSTIKEFMSDQEFCEFQQGIFDMERNGQFKTPNAMNVAISRAIKTILKKDHKELLAWLRGLPYYYETEKQIFVHAGIDEDADDLWKHGTAEAMFTSKYPAETGSFYKDIIAGHVGTCGIAHDDHFHDVYWDGESHYYLDGTTVKSGKIPLLKYDTETGEYTEFRKIRKTDGAFEWVEYGIKHP